MPNPNPGIRLNSRIFLTLSDLQSLGFLAGLVQSDGVKLQGTGFTSSRSGTGTYVITFDTAYLLQPLVFATQVVGSLSSNSMATNPSTSSVTVFSQTGGIGAVDTNFSFLVIPSF